MPVQMLLAAVCGLSVAGLLVAEARGLPAMRAAFKPAASASFVVLAVAAGAFETAAGRAIFYGLLYCAVGDVLLLGRRRGIFLAGMTAFAAGHAAYIIGFILAGAAYRPGVIAALLMTAFAGYYALRRLWPHLARFRAPVAGYALIIGAMVTTSVAASLATGEWRYAVAAVAFAVSDIAVARDRFVREEFPNRLWGLPLYYAAQLLFASAV
jgi:uncharacterized membrane protein YhhN